MYVMMDCETFNTENNSGGGQSPGQKGSILTEFAAICIDPDKWRKEERLHTFHGVLQLEKAEERYPDEYKLQYQIFQIHHGDKLFVEVHMNDSVDRILESFKNWLNEHGGKRPMFISDNNGFDYSWMSFYLWKYLNENPFGHSSTNLGSLYKGLDKNVYKNFKHLREPFPHTHNPVDDCLGNVNAFMKMVDEMGLKI